MPHDPLADLNHTRNAHRATAAPTPPSDMQPCLAIAQSPACDKVFLRTMFDEARASRAADPQPRQLPLAGLAVSVKDLFDIAGQVTTAGSLTRADAAAGARRTARPSRGCARAGGAIIGRTNMTEFAFSGVGINPHFGTPANAASRDEAADSRRLVVRCGGVGGHRRRLHRPGLGHRPARSGSRQRSTASSASRTRRHAVPCDGAIPLSTTLDTVCAMTRSVRDAIIVHEILAARTVTRSHAPLPAYRLAVVRQLMQDDLDADGRTRLRSARWRGCAPAAPRSTRSTCPNSANCRR